MSELERLQKELDVIRGTVNRESDSHPLAEGVLDETRARLQLAMDAAELAIWDFQEPFKGVYLSARWGELLGDKAMEGIWDIREVASGVHPEDLAQVQAEWKRVVKGEVDIGCVHYRFRRPDGRWIWLETRGRVIDRASDGRATRVIGTHAEVTERATAEAIVLEAKLHAEQASRAKSEFLANMSHEVRTPLNAIIGLNRLLLETRIDEEQKQWLSLIRDSADALLGILNEVTDLSRIDAGKLSLNPVLLDFKKVSRSIFNSYAGQIDNKRLKWQMYIDPSVPTWLQMDPMRLRQILNILLSSAKKITSANGNVSFYIDAIEEERRQIVRIRLTDSEIGINPDNQASTIDAFLQAEASTEHQFDGRGLGVALCARLVKMMGGTISVTSGSEHGSCFEIRLPIQTPSVHDALMVRNVLPESPVAHGVSEGSFNGLQILLVEDDPISLLSMTQHLQNMGCFVHDAQDCESAVRKWERYRPDLIFINLQITGIDNLTAAARVGGINRYGAVQPTPILALSAAGLMEGYGTTLNSNILDYVTKPVQLGQLRTAMGKALAAVQDIASEAESKADSPSTKDALAYQTGPLRQSTPAEARHETLGLTEHEMRLLAKEVVSDLNKRLQIVSQACKDRDGATAGREIQNIISSLHFAHADRAIQISRGLDMARRANEWRLFGHMLLLLHEEISIIQTLMGDYLDTVARNDSLQ